MVTSAGWYMTCTPDRQHGTGPNSNIWCETSDPNDPYLAHPDPNVELTWWRLEYDETAKLPGTTMRYEPWPDHPTNLTHPSVTGDR